MSRSQISFARIPEYLENINAELQRNCGSSYRLELSQYRFLDTGKNPAVYEEISNKNDIILCLYHGDRCVSSVIGKYDPSNNSMQLLSKTDVKYEGKKYNLYLRTIFIYLMCFVRPTVKMIVSYATNPISTYTMYKHYHAINPDLQEYVTERGLTPETFTLADAKQFHAYFIEKYKVSNESAELALDEMLDLCEEINGRECSVEDLGIGTREETIEYIIKTRGVTAITLELNLEIAGMQEFLLNKLSNSQIVCGGLAGGKFNRKKSRRNKNKCNKNKCNKKNTHRKKKSRRKL